MHPYANYCVLFDTRFAGGTAQFLHVVVLSRNSEEHISIYLILYHGNSECKMMAESVTAPITARAVLVYFLRSTHARFIETL